MLREEGARGHASRVLNRASARARHLRCLLGLPRLVNRCSRRLICPLCCSGSDHTLSRLGPICVLCCLGALTWLWPISAPSLSRSQRAPQTRATSPTSKRSSQPSAPTSAQHPLRSKLPAQAPPLHLRVTRRRRRPPLRLQLTPPRMRPSQRRSSNSLSTHRLDSSRGVQVRLRLARRRTTTVRSTRATTSRVAARLQRRKPQSLRRQGSSHAGRARRSVVSPTLRRRRR